MRWAERLGLAVILLTAAAMQVRGSEPGQAGEPERAAPGDAQGAAAQRDGAQTELDPIARAIRGSLDAQVAVLDRTEGLLVDKHRARTGELGARARAAYKLLRTGNAPLWVDEPSRSAFLRRRAAARRILGRDLAELRVLQDELDSVAGARQRLERARQDIAALSPPPPGSLHVPVAFSRVLEPFGTYRHGASRAQLTRRGVVLSSKPGRNVRAVAAGVIRFAGDVRGLGHALIVDHGDFLSVLGPLTPGRAHAGAKVQRGEILGESTEDRVYFEVRLEAGAGGYPIDPEPLVERQR